MADTLVVLDAEGLRPAAAMARELPGSRTLLFDPTLLDKAQEAGIERIELQPWCAGADYPELAAWAHREALAVERELDADFSTLFPGARFVGWQHLNLYYLLLTLRWYAELAADNVERFAGGTTHVLVNDNPAHYYWPSFVPGLLLLQKLIGAGHAIRAFSFGRRSSGERLVPDLRGAATQPFDLLTHLPTCFYDAPYFNAELAASGRRIVNLQSRQWNVDIPAPVQVPLVDIALLESEAGADIIERINRFQALAQQRFDQLLQRWIASPAYRERQAAYLAGLVRGQLFTFDAMQRHFATMRPRQLLLTEHDAGFHGPLIAFAARQHLPVLLLPHSKTIGDIEFEQPGLSTLTHPLQADAVADAAGRRILHHRLAYPETFSASTAMPAPLRTVGLLLNGLALGGVQSSAYRPYVDGIARIARWCREQGLELIVRSRPGQVMTDMLVEATGLERTKIAAAVNGPLDAFMRSVDICLMYDAPTNAAVPFLGNGVALLNPLPQSLSRAEALTCNEALVPREDVDSTLARLATWCTDEQVWFMFRKRQFAGYVALFDEALPLRQFV